MLLQTGYKIFAKILALRLQTFLGLLIGDTQHFVSGRRMEKAVAIMMATLQTEQSFQSQLLPHEECPGILFLDFAKAYDTVDGQ